MIVYFKIYFLTVFANTDKLLYQLSRFNQIQPFASLGETSKEETVVWTG